MVVLEDTKDCGVTLELPPPSSVDYNIVHQPFTRPNLSIFRCFRANNYLHLLCSGTTTLHNWQLIIFFGLSNKECIFHNMMQACTKVANIKPIDISFSNNVNLKFQKVTKRKERIVIQGFILKRLYLDMQNGFYYVTWNSNTTMQILHKSWK